MNRVADPTRDVSDGPAQKAALVPWLISRPPSSWGDMAAWTQAIDVDREIVMGAP